MNSIQLICFKVNYSDEYTKRLCVRLKKII